VTFQAGIGSRPRRVWPKGNSQGSAVARNLFCSAYRPQSKLKKTSGATRHTWQERKYLGHFLFVLTSAIQREEKFTGVLNARSQYRRTAKISSLGLYVPLSFDSHDTIDVSSIVWLPRFAQTDCDMLTQGSPQHRCTTIFCGAFTRQKWISNQG
jgi:hypothetical protein